MPAVFENGYALLIGVNDNQVPAWRLPVVAQDVSALHGVLIHADRCGYVPEHVKVVLGEAATRQAILDGLDWLRAEIEACGPENATVVIYYSGHGLRMGSDARAEYYLVPYDVRETTLISRALSARDFASAVSEITPGRLLILLDCCHAGGLQAKEALPARNAFQPAAIPASVLTNEDDQHASAVSSKGLEQLQSGKGRAVLSSSQGSQSSYVRRDNRMSIFTYCVIEALTGYAAPQPGGQEVLVSDLMSHVYRAVPLSAKSEWNVEQIPDFQVSGNFPVAVLLGGKGIQKGVALPDPLVPPPSEPEDSDQGGRGQQIGDTVGPGATLKKGNTVVIQGGGHHITGDIVGGSKVVYTPPES